MGRQRFTPEQIFAKLREVVVLVGRGSLAVEGCRQIGIAEQTLCRWRRSYLNLQGNGQFSGHPNTGCSAGAGGASGFRGWCGSTARCGGRAHILRCIPRAPFMHGGV